MNPQASQQIESRGRVYGGLRIPRFVQGQAKPQIGSAADMNVLIDALNSVSTLSISRGETDSVIITDSNTVLQFMPDSRELSVVGQGLKFLAYWTMEEASGNRLDSINSLPLIPATGGNGVVSQVTGIISKAVEISATSTPYTSDLDTGGVSGLASEGNFSVWGWFKANVASGGVANLGYSTTGLASLGFQIGIASSLTSGLISLTDDTGANVGNFFSFTGGAWNFFCASFTGGALQFTLNGGAPTTYGSGLVIGPSSLCRLAIILSAISGTGAGNYDFDEVGIVTGGALSSAQITAIYNSGAGVTWPAVKTIVTP